MDSPGDVGLAPTLLVVDDELVQRLIASRMAMKMGYEATAVGTLDEAADALHDRNFDLVILDLSLGNRDGIELLRNIALNKRDPLIIFISGFDERVRESAARLAVALGLRVAGTLAKPLNLQRFAAMIDSAPRARPKSAKKPPVSVTPGMLKAALDAGEIRCMYQPKLGLKLGRVVGFECLARWHDAELGAIGPDQFVPMAEQSGLINQLTRHILDTALGQLHSWLDIDRELKVAVNLSPCSLDDLGLPEQVSDALDRHAVEASRLVLEVTEGAVMADYIAAADILTRFRIRGVGLSVDDFGTGHSSLLSLLRLPFDELKIDQSFVRALLSDPDALKIVRAVVSLATSMDLHVVAEGIETQETAQLLAKLGADTGQGYLFAPPLSAAEATAWLRESSRVT